MITISMFGQFGNQLTEHVACKIMAEQTGLAYTPPSRFVDKHGRPVVWTNNEPLIVMEPSEGIVATGKPQKVHCVHVFDFSAIDKTRPVHVERSYFQRYELFAPYKDKIRNEWLRLRKPFLETDDEAVYIHCRRTDYVVPSGTDPRSCCFSATIEEYASCLKQFPDAKRLVIVTDDIRDPFLNRFDKLGIPWTAERRAWDEDFLLLASARQLIICQSTFSWWAAFLGRAAKIVCPVFDDSHWWFGLNAKGMEKGNYVNLYVYDEPDRWIWVRK